MKKKLPPFMIGILSLSLMVSLSSCQDSQGATMSESPQTPKVVSEADSPSNGETAVHTEIEKSSVTFTNDFGDASTVCAHSGCTNTIATSGDTNCCTSHSQNCIDCGQYIDEDAAWCISCIETAASDSSADNDTYDSDSSYRSDVDSIADAYDVSSEDVDAKIQAIIDAMNGN